MNAQHTTGRLKVQNPHDDERGFEIALEPGLEQVCQDVTEANARRLVACWNATIGIPTEMLEAMPDGPSSLLPMYARLEAQRNGLLAALKHIASHSHKMDFDAAAYARAAIAKAGGEA